MKISYVNGICLSNDAISNAIRDGVTWLSEKHDVRLYVYACDSGGLPAHIVSDIADVAFDSHFQSSDLVIFHFGVYYPLFNLIMATPRKAQRIVVFHNITPKEFVAPSSHSLIDKSFAQMSNMEFADHIICDSQTNLSLLRGAGIGRAATVLPLALHTHPEQPARKPSFTDGRLRLAFVGRFVRSKGPTELLLALTELLKARPNLSVQLDLVGNLTFSDQELVAEMEALMEQARARFGPRAEITLRANAAEDEKRRYLAEADIFVLPSYHEGFCVPILEALSSGCRVVAYDNSNIPCISGGLATLIPSGNKEQLAAAIIETADACFTQSWRAAGDDSYSAFAAKAATHVKQFHPDSIRQQFLRLIRRLTPASAWNN